MIADDEVEALGIPGGTLSLLYREIAGHRPGLVTKVGLGTFVDPRVEGGRLNAAHQRLDRRGDRAGRSRSGCSTRLPHRCRAHPCDHRRHRRQPDHGGRGRLRRQPGAGLGRAQLRRARHRRGQAAGRGGSLPPKSVQVPGILVDAIVVDPDQHQTGATVYSPYLAGSLRAPGATMPRLDPGPRKLIARRAADELRRATSSTSATASPVAWPRSSPRRATTTTSRSASSRASSVACPGVGPRLRDGGERPGLHRRRVTVRPLRRRRARCRLRRLRRGRRRRQRQRQQAGGSGGRPRRLHQHHPERQAGHLLRHVDRWRAGGRRRTPTGSRSVSEGRYAKFVERVEHITFAAAQGAAARARGPLRHRAGRVPPGRWRPRADRGRARDGPASATSWSAWASDRRWRHRSSTMDLRLLRDGPMGSVRHAE